jgi:hypothetical protein
MLSQATNMNALPTACSQNKITKFILMILFIIYIFSDFMLISRNVYENLSLSVLLFVSLWFKGCNLIQKYKMGNMMVAFAITLCFFIFGFKPAVLPLLWFSVDLDEHAFNEVIRLNNKLHFKNRTSLYASQEKLKPEIMHMKALFVEAAFYHARSFSATSSSSTTNVRAFCSVACQTSDDCAPVSA